MRLEVNGKSLLIEVDSETPLLWVLRDGLGLTGTKYGCGIAQCGACTVHLGGQPVRSCSVTAGSVGEGRIVTIEGLSGRIAEAVQSAWIAHNVAQCGYCQSGQIMSAAALLQDVAQPDDDAIDAAMSGNICRCATYHRIREAIHAAAATLAGKPGGAA